MSDLDWATLSARVEALESVLTRRDELDAIQQLRPQYCRFVDAKDWNALGSILTVDYKHFSGAEAGVEPTLVAEGADAFRRRLEALTDGATTVHCCFMPDLELSSPTSGRGTWSMTDVVSHPTNAAMRFSGRGHYLDSYRRGEDGQWRIAVTRLVRQRLEPLAVRESDRLAGPRPRGEGRIT